MGQPSTVWGRAKAARWTGFPVQCRTFFEEPGNGRPPDHEMRRRERLVFGPGRAGSQSIGLTALRAVSDPKG